MSDNPRKHGLGRGLSALLGEPNDRAATEQRRDGVRMVATASVRPNPDQPRKAFDEASLAELAESVAAHGILQPILVRAVGDEFEIIAGERRWRAAQRAQLHSIPALVREDGDSTRAELALIENVQRQDLNAIEEAEGYQALIERHGHGQDAVAKLVGKSRSHVANLLRLLNLPDSVRQMLLRGDLSMGHARAVLGAEDPAAVAEQVVAGGLSVRQAEALAKQVKPGAGRDSSRAAERAGRGSADADLAALERQLGDMLGLKVQVKHSGKGGSVTLAYSSLDQLDMICQRLSGESI
ncbi:ParB/RepB/Spo0J family partition protein [Sphingomonas mesophila]|uniref:ParB/RepB/Spo0J family partition protein n=1 Tax=Sphingomonas mesophila TaxID=2303576 RepID=UPI000E56BEB9|nr:ParB/RepB/Spo0J family partition protein [Sphingomonas mesophila]